MPLRRGFKAEAARLAAEIRAELDLAPTAPLDPWRLADHLAVPVIPLSSYREHTSQACNVLLGPQLGAFSAMVAALGPRRTIIHNDGHALTRQRANICHELAHILLFHDGKAHDGEWTYDAEQEDEAKWLGGVLLVTDEACLAGCRAGHSLARAAREMGVSEELMRWRRNKSGAERRVQRERARRAA